MNKLELTWFGKEKELKIEPRILLENKELSNITNDPNTKNMLIHGDNLLALKALEQEYSGQVKCIYIDPPYNTGSAFEHYDDNLEHSTWLSLMKPRLEILHNLLAKEGLIFIQIDDNEQAYLKVLCDEIFGRKNYLNTIAVKAKAAAGASGGGEDKRLKKNYEFLLVYVKDYENVVYNPVSDCINLMDYIKEHKENDVGFYYTRILLNYGQKKFLGEIPTASGEKIKIFEHENFEFSTVKEIAKKEKCSEEDVYKKYLNDIFMVTNAQTSLLTKVNNFVNKKNSLLSYEYIPTTGKDKGKKTVKHIWNSTLVVWLKDSAKIIDRKVFKTQKPGTLWSDLSWGRLDLEGGVKFKSGKKPEKLISKILEMCTNKGDLVLDSFLGSGTTAAVAHKMGRRWIGIEMGDHAYTHCKTRLDKVVAGEDKGGITASQNWQGGGGYKFYELAPTLIKEDDFGQPVINPEYNAEMLAAAVAKHEGYFYNPDPTVFWKQANNQGKSFLFTTTNHVTNQLVETIKSQMQEDEYVLILCRSFDSSCGRYKNIAIKKIPQSLLKNCEFGKDNYNLNIINPPEYEEE